MVVAEYNESFHFCICSGGYALHAHSQCAGPAHWRTGTCTHACVGWNCNTTLEAAAVVPALAKAHKLICFIRCSSQKSELLPPPRLSAGRRRRRRRPPPPPNATRNNFRCENNFRLDVSSACVHTFKLSILHWAVVLAGSRSVGARNAAMSILLLACLMFVHICQRSNARGGVRPCGHGK